MEGPLDRIPTKRSTGVEAIHDDGRPVGGTLLGFWQWAGSDLVGNTLRGWLAEYLVALDLGVAEDPRSEWAAYDLKMQNGTRVEVKASAYVQSWKQQGLSTPRFSIRAARGWDPDTDTVAAHPTRSSDVYVFCLLAHRDQATLDPCNVSQWTFFVIPTTMLEKQLGTQKSVGVTTLRRIGAKEVRFGSISSAVQEALHPTFWA